MSRADPTLLGRFGFTCTNKIRGFLLEISQHPEASAELTDLCKQYADRDSVPWKLIPRACTELRQQAAQDGSSHTLAHLDAQKICHGSSIVFSSPRPRQHSKQMQELLAQLQDQVDGEQYAAMVADVTQSEQQAAAAMQDPLFPNTRLQLSFGLHVLVTMGTFYALGYFGARFLTRNKTWAALCGVVGLTAGLLLETALLILRTNMPQPLEQKYKHLLEKDWQKLTAVPAAVSSGSSTDTAISSILSGAGRSGTSSNAAAAGTVRQRRIKPVAVSSAAKFS